MRPSDERTTCCRGLPLPPPPRLLLIWALAAARAEEDGACPADGSGGPGCAAAAGAAVSAGEGLQWEPQSLSVVLPCAGEGAFARRTVEAVSKSVPGGSGGSILANIVVVDDGSQPALSKSHLPVAFRQEHNVALVRHKKTQGLIRAKAAGAASATGDVIVFFDCHVAPQPGWHKEFLASIAENYRRIVVPVITDLDIDTWKERSRAVSLSKCYLTWDADFKWFDATLPDIPVLSGGLLGISRRWWNETGGYDTEMRGWGGENIDQSLRSWLCGGEIKALHKAFVAHMWRRPDDKRTQPGYTNDVRDALVNRARAAKGWFDGFAEKLDHYPDMQHASWRRLDVSSFREIQARLGCRPFAWYLWRFRDIYLNSGLLPKETFQVRHRKSGYCLTYLGPGGTHPEGRDGVEVIKCGSKPKRTRWPHTPPDPQHWHRANRHAHGAGECCSGLRVWSTDQCLQYNWQTRSLDTAVCDISGQHGVLTLSDGLPASGAGSGGKRLLAPGQLVFGPPGESLREARCLRLLKKRQFKLVRCELAGAEEADARLPDWEASDRKIPLETKLYEEALAKTPELFSDSD